MQETWASDDLLINGIIHIKWEQLRQRARVADRWFEHPHLYVLESSTCFKALTYTPPLKQVTMAILLSLDNRSLLIIIVYLPPLQRKAEICVEWTEIC